jgi:hypothetical protein
VSRKMTVCCGRRADDCWCRWNPRFAADHQRGRDRRRHPEPQGPTSGVAPGDAGYLRSRGVRTVPGVHACDDAGGRGETSGRPGRAPDVLVRWRVPGPGRSDEAVGGQPGALGPALPRGAVAALGAPHPALLRARNLRRRRAVRPQPDHPPDLCPRQGQGSRARGGPGRPAAGRGAGDLRAGRAIRMAPLLARGRRVHADRAVHRADVDHASVQHLHPPRRGGSCGSASSATRPPRVSRWKTST